MLVVVVDIIIMMDVIGIAASYYLYVDSDRYIMIMMKEMVGDHI